MRLLRDAVDDTLDLVDLGLALGDVLTESLTSGDGLRARDTDGLGNLVTSEPLALVIVEETSDGLDTSANLALLLRIGGLPLGVTGVKPRDVLGGQGVHLVGDMGVKHVLEILTSGDGVGSHDVSFLASCAYCVGRNPKSCHQILTPFSDGKAFQWSLSLSHFLYLLYHKILDLSRVFFEIFYFFSCGLGVFLSPSGYNIP